MSLNLISKKLIVVLLIPFLSFSQSDKNPCETLTLISKSIKENHYKPKPINDSLSVYVFDTFIDKLDETNSLFLSSEITELKKHRLKIDNYIKDENCLFLDTFYQAYNKAITRYKNIIQSIGKESIPYSSNEVITFYKKKLPYYKTEAELKHLYKKRLLFDLLTSVSQISTNKDSILTVFKQVADSTKIKVFENYDCESKNKLMSKKEFYSIFFNAFCSYFDSHTMYFSSEDKSDFLSSLSSSSYSFGLNVNFNEKNELSVVEIIPNSSAYFVDKIELGDIIQKIKIDNIEYAVNCINSKVIDETLSSSEVKKAVFTLRKKSGSIYSVELFKQLMRDYQNSVFSYILEYKNNKTGYIKIPSFYSKFENGKTNVSDDVKKEILKLKDDKINNLIIDLENNTGGSMQEAFKLCNLFINAPVLGLLEYSKSGPILIPNENSKPIFNGSIVIITNGYSASASELFTNAMQDYNLALVVGTKSHGKTSIQEIFELKNESKDFVKITLGKFYRVNGKSSQYIGINPSITIPTLFDDQFIREKDFKTALKNESIASYIDNKSYPLSEKQKEVIKKYTSQYSTDTSIQKIIKLKNKVNRLFGDSLAPISLNINSVFDYLNSYATLWKELKMFNESEYNIVVSNNSFDMEKNKNSEYLSNINKFNIKNIKSNFTIFEATKIIGDLQ